MRDSNVFSSVEALQAAEATDHTSLGLVKPKEVTRIYARKKSDAERKEWDLQRDLALKQKDLFVDAEAKTKELRFMPVQYRICFRCNDSACSTVHDFSVLDWGVYVLSRKEFARRGGPRAEQSVISKLQEITDPARCDFHFFLGNTKAHCQKFSIVGLFHPPVAAAARPKKIEGSLTLPGID